MDIIKAEFVKSASALNQMPDELLPEFAFIGRSNVGKSSLINSLGRHRGLARVSATPGKTALINYFKMTIKDEEKRDYGYLVDLPGYGYAKTSKTNRAMWSGFINDYIANSAMLRTVFMLVDSRHEAQSLDLEAIEWLRGLKREVVILLTKTDKLPKNQLAQNYGKLLKSYELESSNMIKYSAVTNLGRTELIEFIARRIDNVSQF